MCHTIAAIATPPGSGGIGIIKISGQDALSVAASVFRKSAPAPEKGVSDTRHLKSFESHRFYHGHVADPENGKVLDEVLLVFMQSPRSYTREDIVEIHAHSGPLVLNAILSMVLRQGVRLAEPGEFTKRAYLSGRIDLTQAEAVIDIINARTDGALEAATAQIGGHLKASVDSVREALLRILAETEAAIDFSEDIEDSIDPEASLGLLRNEVIGKLMALTAQYEDAHYLRDGFRVLIVGRPNVGKSSLMNGLVRKDRAIVTSVPGTTRDLIEETLNIRGLPVIIADAAGLHQTDDPVEKLGIERTHAAIDDADLILFMSDISQPLARDESDIYERICHKKIILVANKSDLVDDTVSPEIPDAWGDMPMVRTSAIYDKGLDSLRDQIAAAATGGRGQMKSAIIPNLRHKGLLDQSLEAALAAAEGIRNDVSPELISIDIQEATDALGEIIGLTVREDILDHIFSNFCIGK
ncbi:MAG: tRNA uridine-5-carboxymethylaminomethyl(34) synthesis GTPase MnmE [Desulfobacteraceae bacterium 4572_88]|nr:MAG: tRNA uridine-5-carboxymethylaminomethyl(34) synthesis GTPase MnmE [Desulfobacteraceae bacterium 4572_88]